MIGQFRSIWERRELLRFLVISELKAENMNKALGFAWSFLNPLLLLGIYTLLVVFIFDRGEPQFPILVFCALLSWRWFTQSLSHSATCISSRARLVQAVGFPLAILPLSIVIVGLCHLLFGFVILIPMLFVFEANITINVLWLPVLLLVQLVGTIGAALIVAVLGTYLSDLANVLQFVLRLGFYVSPVLYSIGARIPERYQTLYMLNPFAGLLESYKNVLVRGLPPSDYIVVAAGVAVVVFVVGFWYFARDQYRLVKAI